MTQKKSVSGSYTPQKNLALTFEAELREIIREKEVKG